MNVFDLMATISLDASRYNEGLDEAKKDASVFGQVFGANLASDAVRKGFEFIVNGTKKIGEGLFSIVKQSTMAYSTYEQMVGGVEKLYGDAADKVMKYANQAYATSAMSANDYMNLATQFSASLINSLNGDVNKAADQTDVAMRAISDNVNTFGSDMQSVSYAFQGFAKQNYTMLDNLKLGYGGTKSEMERLIADANEYAKSIGQASDLSIDSFSDIVTAIELIQEKQGIAGTTAKEALHTVEGSINMVKGAWENLLTAIGTGEGLDEAIDNLITSLVGDETGGGLLNNIIPVVQRAIEGVGEFISKAAPIISKYLPGLIVDLIPPIVESLVTLFAAIIQALPEILKAVHDAVVESVDRLSDEYPIFGKFADTIEKLLPILKAGTPIVAGFMAAFAAAKTITTITSMVTTITSVVSKIHDLGTAFKMASGPIALVKGLFIGNPFGMIVLAIGAAVAAGILLYKNWDKIKETAEKVFGPVVEKLKEFKDSVADAFGNSVEKIKGFGEKVGETFEDVVQWFTDLPGKIAEGIGSAGDAIGNWFESVGEWFETNIPLLIDNIVQSFAELPEKIGYAIGFVIGTLASWAISVGSWIKENVPKMIEAVVTFFRELPGKIWDAITGTIDKLGEWYESVKGWVEENVPKIIDAIVGFFKELPGEIGEWLRNTFNRIRDWGISVAEKAKETGSKFLENVVTFFRELPENVWQWLTTTISRIGEWGRNMWQKAKEIGQKFVETIVKTMKSLPSEMANIGKNIVRGIWKGITGAVGWLQKKIKSFADGIVKGFEKAMGINSPSKVFAGLGRFMAQGLGVGWDDEYGDVKKQITDGLDFDAGTVTAGFKPVSTGGFGTPEGEQMNNLLGLLKQWLPQLANMQMIMDSGETVGALAPKMTRAVDGILSKQYA